MVSILRETPFVYIKNVKKYISRYYILQLIKEDGEIYLIERNGLLGEEPNIKKEKFTTHHRGLSRYEYIKTNLLRSGWACCHLESIAYANGRCETDDFHYFPSITYD